MKANLKLVVPIDIPKMVAELSLIKAEISVLEKVKKEKEDLIKEYMGENEILHNDDGLVLATWKSYDSNKFDTDAFKKASPSIYQSYVSTVTYRRFVIL